MHENRRARAIMSLAVIIAVGLIGPLAGGASAATPVLNGTILQPLAAPPVTLSDKAVAVVTIVDRTVGPDNGGIIGQQRIDAPGEFPIAYAVPYVDTSIVQGHAYVAFASVIDGENVWNSQTPVPVITGGPASNVPLPVVPAPQYAAKLDGSITSTDTTPLNDKAVFWVFP